MVGEVTRSSRALLFAAQISAFATLALVCALAAIVWL
jgi:hypothetical protein